VREAPFKDRAHAGRWLAERLSRYANCPDVLVLALPRGGVPVAFEIARALHTQLDIFLVRKLGVPGQEELAMGAIATGGVCVLNEDIITYLGISQEEIDPVVAEQQKELERRERTYRVNRPPPDLRGRTVILVDDGLATGSTMRAAVSAVRKQLPAKIVIAVPIAAPAVCDDFKEEVDEIVCGLTPEGFFAVGFWYQDFSQTTDEEIRDLLSRAAREQPAVSGGT